MSAAVCVPPPPLEEDAIASARRAVRINPVNAPASVGGPRVGYLAVLTSKYWGAAGVDLTVGFMEPTSKQLREKILAHANAWGETANVVFRWSLDSPQVRITREQEGYWSYLGTDVLGIGKGKPTMCLQGFTERTDEAEFRRVVRHEFGHTLGFPHEHLRRELVSRLDRAKVVAWGRRTQGWDERTSVEQMLTPLEEASVRGTPRADQESVMAYHFGGELSVDGKPILGGLDLSASDREFAALIYPRAKPRPEPIGTRKRYLLEVDLATGEASVSPG